VLYAHKLTTTRRALENAVTLKVLVWCRGRLVTLQILTSSSFSLVEETHGSSGQCVSFSLIGVGSGFTAYVVFFSFSFLCSHSDHKKERRQKEKLRKQQKLLTSIKEKGPLGKKSPLPEKKTDHN